MVSLKDADVGLAGTDSKDKIRSQSRLKTNVQLNPVPVHVATCIVIDTIVISSTLLPTVADASVDTEDACFAVAVVASKSNPIQRRIDPQIPLPTW